MHCLCTYVHTCNTCSVRNMVIIFLTELVYTERTHVKKLKVMLYVSYYMYICMYVCRYVCM